MEDICLWWIHFRVYVSGSAFAAVPLAVFCWLGVWVLFEAAPLWLPVAAQPLPSDVAQSGGGRPVAPSTPGEIDAKYQNLDRLIGATEKRLDDLQKLLAALVSVGTILGIALGLNAYANLKDMQASAEKLLGEIKDLKWDIRRDFPAIAKLNEKIEDILGELKQQVFQDWDQMSYAHLDVHKRQHVLLQEMTFRALSLFDHSKVPKYSRVILEINQGFGRFYSSRYTSSDDPRDSAARERAIFYLESASGTLEADLRAAAQGDLGVLYALQSGFETDVNKKKDIRKKAANWLEKALEYNDSDPRILYVLAWIDRRENRLSKAIQRLTKVIDSKEHDQKRYLRKAYYNRACYRVLEAEFETDEPADTERFKKAIDDLWKAKETAIEDKAFKSWLTDFEKDLEEEKEPKGDLVPLKVSFEEELDQLRNPAAKRKPAGG